MALSSEALTTYATARDVLGFGNDDPQASQVHIERIISSVSEAMVKAACRPFARATVVRERVGSNGTPRLILLRTPIVSVSEIDITAADGTSVYETVPTSIYYIEDASAGFICRPSLWPNTQFWPSGLGDVDMLLPDEPEKRIRVSYVGGWVTPEQERLDALAVDPEGLVRDLPYDLEEACLNSVASVFRRSGQNTLIQSENSQTVSKSFRETNDMLTPETLKIVHRYARYA